jgi:hypothetical protein
MQMKKEVRGINVGLQVSRELKFLRNISVILLIVKFMILFRITPLRDWTYQGHMWLGADGENYLIGVNALSRDGIFSNQNILYYWPAGYPLFIYLFGIFGKAQALTFLGIFQSTLFSFSIYALGKELLLLKFKRLAKVLVPILLFNPTLSLSSLAVGYESISASAYLLIIALAMYFYREINRRKQIIAVVIIAISLSFISSLQPRLILSGLFIGIVIFLINQLSLKKFVLFLIFCLSLAVFPSSLVLRNNIANGINVLSTNLGVTMNIGAGNDATGAYRGTWKGVPCTYSSSDKIKSDNELVKCVLTWYLQNPIKSAKLFWNKTQFFWSPWFGPESIGTMARNPWQQINPLRQVASTANGYEFVYGLFGKVISWVWMILSFTFLIFGLAIFCKKGGTSKKISFISIAIILPSWLISLVTLGDNRFRLPVLGVCVIFQVVGWLSIFDKKFKAELQSN